MAADTSYPLIGQGVYIKQGDNELVVGSTSTLTVVSGATVTDAGTHTLTGALTINTPGSLTMGSSAPIQVAVVTPSSGATIPSNGHATLTGGTTATGAKTYTLSPPTAGCLFTCHVTTANTSDKVILDLNGPNLSGYGTQDIIHFTTGATFLQLRGLSTSAWAVIGITPGTTADPTSVGVHTTS